LYGALAKTDPKAMEIMKKEVIRIRNGVELIPSENFVSKAVLQAMATVFTNKYSEVILENVIMEGMNSSIWLKT